MWMLSEYVGNKDDCKSISGTVSILGEMIVGWTEKNTIFLSSSKSEYIANGEACQKEAMFMIQLIVETFEWQVNAVGHSENPGALFLVKHHQV